MDITNGDPADLKKQIELLDAHYRRLVDSISEGVSVVTLEGVIASLSPAFESLTGWTTSQLIGSHVQALIHPADLPLTIERLQRLNNGEQVPPAKLRLLQSTGDIAQLRWSRSRKLRRVKLRVFGHWFETYPKMKS